MTQDESNLVRKTANVFYVYTHADQSGAVFYVGKGINDRAIDFWGRSRYHLSKLAKVGRENVRVRVVWAPCEGDAYLLERRLIEAYKLSGRRLCNHDDGGGVGSRRVFSPEHRAKLSAAGIGHAVSAEARRKIGAAHIGRVPSDEARAKMAAKKLSVEHREALRSACVGRPVSAETRAKIAATKLGRPLSPEHRKKLSDARRRGKA